MVSEEHLQPIRFQGQSFDVETGLHYNRFRYFDPDLGMFTTRDPIGLLGGSNVFQYAPNPTGWIDPFGLNRFTKTQYQAPANGTGYSYTVYQQPINWDLPVNTADGVKTNLQLAENGRSPFVVKDGKYTQINLHHSNQNAKGPLFEITANTHNRNYSSNALHPHLPNAHPINPVGDRTNFNTDRDSYWKNRASIEQNARAQSASSGKC